jgi:hypothetical protein
LPKRHKQHEIVASHRLLLNVWMMAEAGEPLHEVIANLFAGRALADDEGFLS